MKYKFRFGHFGHLNGTVRLCRNPELKRKNDLSAQIHHKEGLSL